MMTEAQHDRALTVVSDPRPRLPSLARHLEPERLIREHGSAISSAMMSRFSEDLLRTAQGRSALEAALAKVPSMAVLALVYDALTDALAIQPSRSVNTASVAILFDSRARQPANPAVYIEALIYDLLDEGFPPCVVVAACQRLRREATFTPEIPEVLKVCREVLAKHRAIANLTHILANERGDAEDRLRIAEREEQGV